MGNSQMKTEILERANTIASQLNVIDAELSILRRFVDLKDEVVLVVQREGYSNNKMLLRHTNLLPISPTLLLMSYIEKLEKERIRLQTELDQL